MNLRGCSDSGDSWGPATLPRHGCECRTEERRPRSQTAPRRRRGSGSFRGHSLSPAHQTCPRPARGRLSRVTMWDQLEPFIALEGNPPGERWRGASGRGAHGARVEPRTSRSRPRRCRPRGEGAPRCFPSPDWAPISSGSARSPSWDLPSSRPLRWPRCRSCRPRR